MRKQRAHLKPMSEEASTVVNALVECGGVFRIAGVSGLRACVLRKGELKRVVAASVFHEVAAAGYLSQDGHLKRSIRDMVLLVGGRHPVKTY